MLAASPPGDESYGGGLATPSTAAYDSSTLDGYGGGNGNNENDADIDLHQEEDDGAYANEWDEGGPSQCGYHEAVHYTLMTVGKSVHGVVGAPSQGMERGMKTVGNWFQEASYAVRDFCRGNKQELGDDASAALSTMKDDAMAAVNDIMGTSSNLNAVDANALNEATISASYNAQEPH
jgi:hypothetical protein